MTRPFRRAAARASLGAAALGALLAAAPAAPAATLLDGRVATDDAQKRRCHTRLADGDGVVQRTIRLPAATLLRARLSARGGDWDLGLFDKRTGRSIGGSAAFGSRELAEGFAAPGRIVVQACRRTGSSRSAKLRVGSYAMPGPEAGKERAKVQVVRVSTPDRAAKKRLQSLGLDLTEHGDAASLDAVLHGAGDHAKLRSAGFTYTVEIEDLVARHAQNRLRDARFAVRTKRSSLPSGRDDYRRLPDFEADMKALAERRPDLVKPLVLPHRSLEGRQIQGIEITNDVAQSDGKPVYLQMGTHHAREWPSSEAPMELAVDLVTGYGSDQRITGLVDRVRTIVIPVINPDGYNLSREAPVDLRALGTTAPLTRLLLDVIGPVGVYDALGANAGLVDQAGGNPGGIAAIILDESTGNFAYKRRNCRIVDGQVPAMGECAKSDNRTLGTDPNRNYGGFWGGPGASPDPTVDSYRGAGPFSEPETQNVRELISSRQVTTMITNHTYSNLVLRPPGTAAEGTTPDEPIYKELGDAMGTATAYTSQYGYELYDTTGTTEDWSYFQTGGLGYTFEIGPHEFHPPYEQVIAEYEGRPPTPVDGIGRPQKHGGLREAYLLAMESTADTTRHSVLTGRSAPGTRLSVSRSGTHLSSPVVNQDGSSGEPIVQSETARSSMTVPSGGAFEWHLNPSTRPYARKDRTFVVPSPTPSSTEEISGGPATETVPIDITEADKSLGVTVDVGEGDYDLYLYEGDAVDEEKQVASGTNGFVGADEVLVASGLPPGRYTLEVRNFAAVAPWTGTISKFPGARTVSLPPTTESWKLTCTDAAGAARETQNVTVDRGQRIDLGTVCGGAAASGPLVARSPQRSGLQLRVTARRVKLGTLRRRGMRVSARCSARCASTVALRVSNRTARRYGLTRKRSGSVTVGRVRLSRMTANRTRTARLRLTPSASHRLPSARRVAFTLTGSARSTTGQRRAATLRLTLRR